MVIFSVEIDFTFIELIQSYLNKPSEYTFSKIIDHKAARGVYTHASRFRNTDKDLHDF